MLLEALFVILASAVSGVILWEDWLRPLVVQWKERREGKEPGAK